MTAQVLSERVVRALPPPATGNRVYRDAEVRGFGVRVTYTGARSFIVNYRARGRERGITIGSHPDWSVQAAREGAKSLVAANFHSLPNVYRLLGHRKDV